MGEFAGAGGQIHSHIYPQTASQAAFRELVPLSHLLFKAQFWGTSHAKHSTLKPHSGLIPGEDVDEHG